MTPAPTICTVVTKSYLGYARALDLLFRRHHPGGRCVVLVSDEPDGCYDPKAEAFEIVSMKDLAVSDPDCMRFQYTAFELCNALKPFLLLHILKRTNIDRVFYLDADMGVMAPLGELFRELDEASVLLTPHTSVPFPEDGCWPDANAISKAGTYNAGVVGVRNSPEGIRFLEWWRDRLITGCIDDPDNGFYVDQKYLEEVPGKFAGVRVLQHDGVNVAHFNLHSRTLAGGPENRTCNGHPLLLFHFTQANYGTGDFWPPVSRPLVKQQPLLKELIRSYGRILEDCHVATTRKWPYTWGHFPDGTPISGDIRRQLLKECTPSGRAADANPFLDPSWLARQKRHRMQDKSAAPLLLFARAAGWLRRRFGK
ncbi:MAG TPA: hypothetical protein VK968_11520 [Roseimicrobium sp.]|nr:hypothetical protein [Roseimicrobium sp.]